MSPTARIYADYNATAPLRSEAKAAMLRALDLTGNPSSVHAEGRKARTLVEAAREAVAGAIGACRDDIAFTSGGTEAVQTAIKGAAFGAFGQEGGHISLIVSAIEHDCALAVEDIHHRAYVSADGRVSLGALEHNIDEIRRRGGRPFLSLMLVNNETGVIQPVAKAAEIVHAAGGLIHCDAIQALGKTDVSIIELDVDYLSLSAHKIGGPQGVGAFYVKPGAPFCAVQTGGGQEFGRRAGTENVAGIAGFGAAVEAALAGVAQYEGLRVARDAMEARLKSAAPSLTVHGEAAPRVAGVSCFGVDGLPAETQIMGLDLAGFAVSAGSACSSGKVKPSHVLTAMGLSDTAARSAIRASFGWASKAEDFEALATAWLKMAARARPQLVKLDANV